MECCGNGPKEVTLCQIVDCPLWQFRCGYSMLTKNYSERMTKASKNYPNEYKEMVKERAEYEKECPNSAENEQIDALLEKKAA